MKREEVLQKLGFTIPKEKRIRVIVHSDLKNEADDQYAVTHHLLSPNEEVLGIIAGHFEWFPRLAEEVAARGEVGRFGEGLKIMLSRRGRTMQMSYEEGERLLSLAEIDDVPLLKGAQYELAHGDEPSEGAGFIVQEAMKEDPRPLFVCFLGGITDLAAAYRLEPRIAQKLTAVWIGGGSYPAGNPEFNLCQDIDAANLVFESDIPLWQVPQDVYRTMEVSFSELALHVAPCGKLGKYLFEELIETSQTIIGTEKDRFPECEVTYAYGYDFAGTDESGFDEALKAIEGADVAILTLGGKCGTGARCSMGENVNSTSIGLPPAQEQFIRRAAALHKPLIGVHFDGRPISSDAADECLNAILECWNPSQFGSEAAVALLAGDETPSGKLPVTVARNAGQLPLYYSQPFGSGYRPNEFYKDSVYIDSSTRPRYYFGHGLSYTSFGYSDLSLDKTALSAEDTLTLSFTLKNTGEREGTEVVQLYLCDPAATVARPAKQLLGFARVPLRAGEERRVTFSVPATLFAFLDEEMKWKAERGEMQLLVGASSEDIRLTASVSVKEDAYIDPSSRAFFAEVK